LDVVEGEKGGRRRRRRRSGRWKCRGVGGVKTRKLLAGKRKVGERERRNERSKRVLGLQKRVAVSIDEGDFCFQEAVEITVRPQRTRYQLSPSNSSPPELTHSR